MSDTKKTPPVEKCESAAMVGLTGTVDITFNNGHSGGNCWVNVRDPERERPMQQAHLLDTKNRTIEQVALTVQAKDGTNMPVELRATRNGRGNWDIQRSPAGAGAPEFFLDQTGTSIPFALGKPCEIIALDVQYSPEKVIAR